MTTAFASIALAQGPTDLSGANPPSAAEPASPAPLPDTPSTSAAAGEVWRARVSIYGWFPGLHGTVGVLDHDASVHASFSNVFHYLKGVIPIAVEANVGRFLMPIDFFWVKLGDDRAIPLNDLGQTSVNLHITESILTPKIGYRVYDGDHFKVDALAGIRFWYVSQNVSLVPSGLNNSRSANWVDGLGGMRFVVPLSEKAAVTVAGDAGGGGANLDYQVVGLFTYNFTPKLGLGLGWRYLDVDYRQGHQFLYDVAQSGALAGLYFDLGGKPAPAPTASCMISPAQVMAGEPVKATISTQNFNPKHTVGYKWEAAGAKVSGPGETATVDTTGLAPGSYTVSGTATDAKEKKNNSANCSATFAVLQPPQHPPVATCSATPGTVKAGDPATVNVTASSPDGVPLTYSYSASSGSINGSGNSATLDTTTAQPGSTVTTTATVTDSRGLTASCTAVVNILSPPVVVQEVKELAECKFMNPKKPWRVDNECKAILDEVALRIQREPNGKLVVVGYAEDEEVATYDQLGSQRAVNIKYYLTEGEGQQHVDAALVQPVKGSKHDKSAKIYFVPAGATFSAEETVNIDETVIQGQPRNAPAPKKKAKAGAQPKGK
jgi:hypothetical protein